MRDEADHVSGHTRIRVGMATCSIASGAGQVLESILGTIDPHGSTTVETVGCMGMCNQEPLVEVIREDGARSVFGRVPPPIARRITRQYQSGSGLLRRLAAILNDLAERFLDDMLWISIDDYRIDMPPDGAPVIPPTPPQAPILEDSPVTSATPRREEIANGATGSVRIVTENCGRIDPRDIDAYIERGGYQALTRSLNDGNPQEIIAVVSASGLRGRGGAGFPVGRKWATARQMVGNQKVVICNADEGDPGAFMDRLVLESDPHRVLEGLAIAAFAVGAGTAIVYVRAEYPLAVANLRAAVVAAEARGLLGSRILNSEFSLDVKMFRGAGDFVCGEETALMASVEGRRGMPRPRPPFPTESGLWGRPTVVNNVETLATIPWILRHGPDIFAQLGTPRSTGTKVFAVAGKVQNPGLVEVELGVTIRTVVDELGGGAREGHQLKAVQIGGPSGGCLPEHLFDTPLDYDHLQRVGMMMGSGGIVVLDDSDCMVDLALFFTRFSANESCGKCTSCRIGTVRMREALARLTQGLGNSADLTRLEDLGNSIKVTSLCGLGQTAPNPLLSTLRYFRAEFEAHIAGQCPAGKCASLTSYIVSESCIGCTLCATNCPVDAIPAVPYRRHEINALTCVRCGTCKVACPEQAIQIVRRHINNKGTD